MGITVRQYEQSVASFYDEETVQAGDEVVTRKEYNETVNALQEQVSVLSHQLS